MRRVVDVSRVVLRIALDWLARVPGVAACRYWVGRIPAAWKHDFRDSRLILEREGNLHYFQLTARLQRGLTRAAIVTTAVLFVTLTSLIANNVRVAVVKARLERAQLETYQSLLALNGKEGTTSASVNQDALRQLAEEIKAKQATLQTLLDTSVSAISDENTTLQDKLRASGLSPAQIEAIQNSLPAGGAPVSPSDAFNDPTANRLGLVGKLIRNRELKDVLRAMPGRMPLANYAITSDFGLRRHPILGKVDAHEGVDLVPTGTDDVKAVAGGVVKVAQYHPEYGNMVVVNHGGGIETLYGHLASIAVKQGQTVSESAILGRVGSTGLSTGKHLHFEVLVGGHTLDPEKVVSAARTLQENKERAGQ